MTEPPEIKNLDFSQAHFLDHWPWECRQYEHAAGGWRTHLKYAWDFKWRSRLRAATKCRVGWHYSTQIWETGPEPMTYDGCIDCWKPLSEKRPA